MPRANANGIEIEYETFGDNDRPALLLVMGLGAQMISWDERFCQLLADEGYHVIRYDNRDVGRSTWFDHAGGEPDAAGMVQQAFIARMADPDAPANIDAPYLLDDLADDAAGLLDALGIAAAHVVGASMGGMIVQALAIRHPERVLSLCSIMSTTGDPSVGGPTPEAMAALLERPPADRDGYVEAAVRASRVIGSPGFPFDEDRVRRRAATAFDRGYHPAGTARQLVAIVASPDRTPALRSLDVPALVIHGADDPLVQASGGQATARAIPGAELLVIPGMGHDLPQGAWAQIVEAVVANAARAQVRS
ncbi:MAG TPA: alpha/beta hydrolase [Acidimicrobiales bacterium]|nr:alpha/beta hydrolase [Acidimicrobiales bacterium]